MLSQRPQRQGLPSASSSCSHISGEVRSLSLLCFQRTPRGNRKSGEFMLWELAHGEVSFPVLSLPKPVVRLTRYYLFLTENTHADAPQPCVFLFALAFCTFIKVFPSSKTRRNKVRHLLSQFPVGHLHCLKRKVAGPQGHWVTYTANWDSLSHVPSC